MNHRNGRVCGRPVVPIGFYTKKGVTHPVFAHGSSTRIRGVSPYPTVPTMKVPHVHRVVQGRVRAVPVVVKTPIPAKVQAKAGESRELNLNARAYHSLENKYGVGKTGEILRQAQDSYHFHHPSVEQNAETYELFENGNIDEAIESLGLPAFVIGRPKLLHRVEGGLVKGRIPESYPGPIVAVRNPVKLLSVKLGPLQVTSQKVRGSSA